MKKFHVLGSRLCPRSRLDLQKIYNYFQQNGWVFTSEVKDADIIVYFPCGAFTFSEKEFVRIIEQLLKDRAEDSNVIITGCLPKINPTLISEYNGFKVVPYAQFNEVDGLIDAKIKFYDIQDANLNIKLPETYKKKLNYNTIKQIKFNKNFIRKSRRYLVKKIFGKEILSFSESVYNIMISRGCLGNCTYCTIKLSHGKVKSKPIENILNEFKQGLEKGYSSFVLMGEDVGCYGMDIKTNITALLQKIFEYKQDFKLIINDFNPQWLIT